MSRTSVVVVTYNHGAYLGQALDSVLHQTRPPSELIVVDDGSTDGTADLLAGYRDRIRVLRQENRGVRAARNAGLREAREDLVAFLDADDFWEPTALERMTNGFDRDDVGLVAPAYQSVDESGIPLGAAYRKRSPGLDFTTRSLLLTDADIPGCAYRRSVFAECGPFDESFRRAGDYEMWLRLSTRFRLRFAPEALLFKRVHAGNLSHAMLQRIPAHIACIRKFLDEHPDFAARNPRLAARSLAKNYERLARASLLDENRDTQRSSRVHSAEAIRLAPLHPRPYLLLAVSVWPDLYARWKGRHRRA